MQRTIVPILYRHFFFKFFLEYKNTPLTFRKITNFLGFYFMHKTMSKNYFEVQRNLF